MPRQKILTADNNFHSGLITEATGLNFPENAVTDTDNCVFNFDGSVERRLGFGFESGYTTKTINREGKAISSFLWENVSGNGDVSLLVQQVGDTLYFYETSSSSSFSLGAVVDTVFLNGPVGNPDPSTVECQYTSGNGYLFVTHPYCYPQRITYNTGSHDASRYAMELFQRDFEGATSDPLAGNQDPNANFSARPTATLSNMNIHHHYNLLNQGWTDAQLAAWDTARSDMPSNADVMWRFKNSSDALDYTSTVVDNIIAGNSRAPMGHYILNITNLDRDLASNITGINATMTNGGGYYPATSAFHAGRVFYAGLPSAGFNTNIYFSQVATSKDQYQYCYQVNDPTSEDLFDILPTDGGVINIQEAGTIIKLVSIPNGLAVFSANGVWFITGSQGIGFTANDYSVTKISNVPCLTASSFVNVEGMPCWWNADNICMLVQGQDNASIPQVQKISLGKIDTFFGDIPITSKRFARGAYSSGERRIQWIYKGTSTNQVTELYEFDKILNFDLYIGAFYPWSIDTDSTVKINGIVSSNLPSRFISLDQIIDDAADIVIDGSGNNVVASSGSGTDSAPFVKYLVSYADSGSYKHSFGEVNATDYADWTDFDFDSYFSTGYKLKGAGLSKFGNNYVRIFSDTSDDVRYYFQAMWDYATTGDGTGRWSVRQLIEHSDEDYRYSNKRLKVRGYGSAMQFRVSSLSGERFHIIGWNSNQLVNETP